MTGRTVRFYEKPGCINNTKQKRVLRDMGFDVDARDLLNEAWDFQSLRPFFGDLPVRDWFNPAAPMVKSGAVDPTRLNEAEALAAMVEEPLLIRRPLLETDLGRTAGWVPGTSRMSDIGLDLPHPDEDIVTCPQMSRTA